MTLIRSIGRALMAQDGRCLSSQARAASPSDLSPYGFSQSGIAIAGDIFVIAVLVMLAVLA